VTELSIQPVGPDRFADIATLFGPNGANGGCWCMWWRISGGQWRTDSGAAKRAAFEAVVRAGQPAGLLAYRDGVPAGWCAVAPRTAYPRLLRSPTLRLDPRDGPGVWSVTCFFIHRRHRRSGVARALLPAAVNSSLSAAATAVEGYPIDTGGERRASSDLYTGTVDLFTGAGFTVHSRPGSGRRIVMRRWPT
jgi:GNAT superfamily N-acetyltransferase